MPLFTYKCACGVPTKRIVSKGTVIKCPACKEEVTQDAINSINTILQDGDRLIYSEKEIEKRIAIDSEVQWDGINKEKIKRKERAKELNSNAMTLKADGTYGTVDKKELELRERVKESMIYGKSESGLKPIAGRKLENS